MKTLEQTSAELAAQIANHCTNSETVDQLLAEAIRATPPEQHSLLLLGILTELATEHLAAAHQKLTTTHKVNTKLRSF